MHWCDQCLHNDHLKVEGNTILLAIGHAEPREIDLCEEHQESLSYAQVIGLLNEYGREYIEPEIDPDLLCPVLECERHDAEPFKNVGGRNLHLWRIHGIRNSSSAA